MQEILLAKNKRLNNPKDNYYFFDAIVHVNDIGLEMQSKYMQTSTLDSCSYEYYTYLKRHPGGDMA